MYQHKPFSGLNEKIQNCRNVMQNDFSHRSILVQFWFEPQTKVNVPKCLHCCNKLELFQVSTKAQNLSVVSGGFLGFHDGDILTESGRFHPVLWSYRHILDITMISKNLLSLRRELLNWKIRLSFDKRQQKSVVIQCTSTLL